MLELIDGRTQATPVHIPRPSAVGSTAQAERVAREVVADVNLRGDAALVEYAQRWDRATLTPDRLRVDPNDILKARNLVPPELLEALQVMADRLRPTCERQRPEEWIDQRDDEFTGELIRPLRRVGIYAPGGRATYPSSVIMAAVPAQVAGVGGIAVCSPPRANGALAYGTESVRPVEKVVGPGNLYVTYAKRAVLGWVGIDAEAGPTEIAIVADESMDAALVAAHLVAQAGPGPPR